MCLNVKHLGKNSPNKLKGESKTRRASKIEFFVTLVNNKKPLTNVTRRFITDVAKVLHTPLKRVDKKA